MPAAARGRLRTMQPSSAFKPDCTMLLRFDALLIDMDGTLVD